MNDLVMRAIEAKQAHIMLYDEVPDEIDVSTDVYIDCIELMRSTFRIETDKIEMFSLLGMNVNVVHDMLAGSFEVYWHCNKDVNNGKKIHYEKGNTGG